MELVTVTNITWSKVDKFSVLLQISFYLYLQLEAKSLGKCSSHKCNNVLDILVLSMSEGEPSAL